MLLFQIDYYTFMHFCILVRLNFRVLENCSILGIVITEGVNFVQVEIIVAVLEMTKSVVPNTSKVMASNYISI